MAHGTRPVLVVGMHRSGTSAITRCLGLMGLDFAKLGQGDFMPRSKEQPRGYWELQQVERFNNAVLKAHGYSWDKPPAPGWIPQNPGDVDELAGIIGRIFPRGSSWVCKDPRFCFLLPLWREALSRASFERPAIVFIHRKLEEVVDSLVRWRDLPRSIANTLWWDYNRAAALNLQNEQVAVVSFAALRSDPMRTLEPLASRLRAFDVELRGVTPAAVASVFPSDEEVENGGTEVTGDRVLRALLSGYERFPEVVL